MKQFVVAVDFSGGSIHALKYAINLANMANANISMIWVDKIPEKESIYEVSDKTYRDEAKRRFEELIQQFKPLLKGGNLDFKIKTGKIYSEIVTYAQSLRADLIFAGSHGVSGFEEFWIGSNANRIVANALCPVITVRNGFPMKDRIYRIVMPLDNTSITLGKLDITTKLARITGAEVHIMALYTTNLKTMHKRVDSFVEKAIKYLESENVPYFREDFFTQNTTQSVIDYAKKVDADLISIMTEQEGALVGILGPNAQQIVNHSPVPVLSVHPSDAGRTF